MKCKYCGRKVTKDDVIKRKEAWHRNCKTNTLGIHIEEAIDLKDLFG